MTEHEDPGHEGPGHEGPGIVQASFAGTGAFVVAAAGGATDPDRLGWFTAAVSGALFAVGVVAFLWGYGRGVIRSRDEKVTLAGLFFLSHTAPRVVRVRLLGALFVQVVVATAVVAVRPYTSVAAAVLAPMFGLGTLAWWGARYGTFFAKGAGTDAG